MSVDDVLAARGQVYGDFQIQAEITGKILAAIITGGLFDAFPPDMAEALLMIAVKIARIRNGNPHHIDNWDDIAGYATLVANRLRAEQATASARK